MRDEHHDVFSVQEQWPEADDSDILDLSYAQQRILLTEDTDFGELVYRLQRPAAGVVLLRLGAVPVGVKLARLRKVMRHPERIEEHFIVVEAHRLRRRPLLVPPG